MITAVLGRTLARKAVSKSGYFALGLVGPGKGKGVALRKLAGRGGGAGGFALDALLVASMLRHTTGDTIACPGCGTQNSKRRIDRQKPCWRCGIVLRWADKAGTDVMPPTPPAS
jgi:hypothetical protein